MEGVSGPGSRSGSGLRRDPLKQKVDAHGKCKAVEINQMRLDLNVESRCHQLLGFVASMLDDSLTNRSSPFPEHTSERKHGPGAR